MKNKKIKIIITSPTEIRSTDTEFKNTLIPYELARKLVDTGYSVTYVSAKYLESKERTEDGIAIRHIGFSTRFRTLNILSYFITLPFVLKKFKGDIVVESLSPLLLGSFLPYFTKRPVIALYPYFSLRSIAETSFIAFIQKYNLRKYISIVLLTNEIERELKQIHSSLPIDVIPVGVDERYFKLKKKNPEYILFLDTFVIKKKGIDLLLESYLKIAKKMKYPLALAGHGKDEKKIRTFIAKHKMAKHMMLLGPTYGEKKIAVLSKALYVAYPVRENEMTLFPIEAIAAGVPLVIFDTNELSWANSSFSVKALPFDTRDYARLLKYTANKSSLPEMSKKARMYSRKFKWQKIMKTYDSLFRKILSVEKIK